MNNKLFASMGEKKVKYSLKKTHFGVVSVAVATLLSFGNIQTVSAAEEVSTEQAVETVQEVETAETGAIEEAAEEPVEEEATEEEVVEKTEEVKEVGNDPDLVIKEIVEDETYGDEAFEHIDHITNEIGSRVVGTEGEKAAREYITGYMKGLGYGVELQEFEFERGKKDNKKTYQSSNIISVKKGQSEKELIIGAHYDSVSSGQSTGADDNASGIVLLLETAQRIFNKEIPYSVRFIFFGAEEMGKLGSTHFVENLTDEQKENIIGMVNIDSVLAGDFNYMYSGTSSPEWLRDQAFDIAWELGIDDIKTNEGYDGYAGYIPYGQTGDWSDHDAFDKAGIPIVYFESSNWALAEDEDGNPIEVEPGEYSEQGYIQTKDHGRIYHTENDNLTFLMTEFPGRVERSLGNFAAILYNLVMNVTLPGEGEQPEEPGDTAGEVEDPSGGETEKPSENDVVDPNENTSGETVEDPKGQGGNAVHAAEESKTLPATGEATTLATSLAMLAGGLGLSFAFKKRD